MLFSTTRQVQRHRAKTHCSFRPRFLWRMVVYASTSIPEKIMPCHSKFPTRPWDRGHNDAQSANQGFINRSLMSYSGWLNHP